MKKVGLLSLILLTLVFAFSLVSAGQLKVTEEHPFLVNGSWISAHDLKVGDILQTVDGKKVKITSLEDMVSSDNFSVYNLEAGIYHDFVVNGGDDLGVVVHNSNGPGVCFTADTLISLADGTKKRIADVKIGDKVLSYNLSDNQYEISTVNQISKHLSDDIYLINDKLKVTSGHPFWTKELGWAAINDSEIKEHPELKLAKLEVGLHLIDDSGDFVQINSITQIYSIPVYVYNFVDLGVNHNYFAGGVLVHNSGNPCANDWENARALSKADEDEIVKALKKRSEELPEVSIPAPIRPQYSSKLDPLLLQDSDFFPIMSGDNVAFWMYAPKGVSIPKEGFKFHISAEEVTKNQVYLTVSKILKSQKIPFKVDSDLNLVSQGFSTQIGKFITVYPSDAKQLVNIAKVIDDSLVANGLSATSDSVLSLTDRAFGSSGRIAYRYATNGDSFKFVGGKRLSVSSAKFQINSAGNLVDRRIPGYYNPPGVFDEVDWLASQRGISVESIGGMRDRIISSLSYLESRNAANPSRLARIQKSTGEFTDVMDAYTREGYTTGLKSIVPDMTRPITFDELYSSIVDMGAYYSVAESRYISSFEAISRIKNNIVSPAMSSGSISSSELSWATRTGGVRDAVKRLLLGQGITITP